MPDKSTALNSATTACAEIYKGQMNVHVAKEQCVIKMFKLLIAQEKESFRQTINCNHKI